MWMLMLMPALLPGTVCQTMFSLRQTLNISRKFSKLTCLHCHFNSLCILLFVATWNVRRSSFQVDNKPRWWWWCWCWRIVHTYFAGTSHCDDSFVQPGSTDMWHCKLQCLCKVLILKPVLLVSRWTGVRLTLKLHDDDDDDDQFSSKLRWHCWFAHKRRKSRGLTDRNGTSQVELARKITFTRDSQLQTDNDINFYYFYYSCNYQSHFINVVTHGCMLIRRCTYENSSTK